MVQRLVKRLFTYLTLILACMFLSTQAMADNIKTLRAYANNDKTRVVLDLDFKPRFSQALADDASSFILRVNNVTNYASAPDHIALDKKSAIKSISKNIQHKDVRYIFSLKGSGTPNVFLLNPQSGHNYRLVIDFPHSASNYVKNKSKETLSVLDKNEANRIKGQGSGVGTPPLNVITVQDVDVAEKALLNSLSTVGQDGIRTMTPEQVKAYERKLANIRQAQQKSPNKHVEEEVLDTQAPPPPLVQDPILSYKKPFIIAIDAGHGGKDPGAIGRRGVREKNVTLAIAIALSKYINANKMFRAKLIRSKDVFVDLNKRSEIARYHKADILISIHADSVASGSKARGASVWVLSNNRAKRENGKILKQKSAQSKLLGGAGEVMSQASQNPYLAATILDMTSDNARSEGFSLGAEILHKLGGFTRLHNKKPIPASLAVLKSPDIPSLLIETGFLSNPYEEIQLNQPNYQKQIAYAIYMGIKTYYEKYPAQMLKSRQDSAMRYSSNQKVHIVKKGEYLAKIARSYNVSLGAIKKVNNLKKDTVFVGQKLVIPR